MYACVCKNSNILDFNEIWYPNVFWSPKNEFQIRFLKFSATTFLWSAKLLITGWAGIAHYKEGPSCPKVPQS